MPDEDGYFGEEVAARYDESSAEMFDPAVVEPAVDFLAELVGEGRALELGIGTGRVALPLAARGVPVLRHRAVEGDGRAAAGEAGWRRDRRHDRRLRDGHGDGTFSLAYLVFNTINNLTTQDGQVACFRNVARHLEPGGRFVIEVGVPGLRHIPPGETFHVFDASATHWGIDEYDVASQGLVSHHFSLVDGRWQLRSVPFRYVWPSELDLMAELAGMTLRERWSDWQRAPFTSESRQARLRLGEALSRRGRWSKHVRMAAAARVLAAR